VARDDVVTCRLDDPVGPIAERVAPSPYGFALVTTEDGILLGRLRASVMRDAPAEATAEAIMEPGPTTVRADTLAADLAQRLTERDLKMAALDRNLQEPLKLLIRKRLAGAGYAHTEARDDLAGIPRVVVARRT